MNKDLKTRVNELEVINDLFRGRVTELEASEAEARKRAESLERELADLKRTVDELKSAGKRKADEVTNGEMLGPKRAKTVGVDGEI